MRHAGLGTGVAQVLGVLGPGQLLGGANDHVQAHEHLDVLGIAPGFDGTGTDLVHLSLGRWLVLATDEHTLGMPPGEQQTAIRTAGLEQHRRALRRGFAEVITLDLIELALVLDLVHFVRLRVDPLPWIVEHRAVFPTAFQEFVKHLQVLIGLVIAAVMLDLFAQTHGLGGAVEIAGDDVPADPPTAQVIQGRQAAGEQIRRFVGEVGGQAETEVFRHRRHGRDQQQRVVDRQLDRLFQRHVHRALVDVVDPDDVGDEQAVEQPALQQLRQFGPVLEGVVAG
ncbi:hypothetical protein D3C75_633390 [compost metagenome]